VASNRFEFAANDRLLDAEDAWALFVGAVEDSAPRRPHSHDPPRRHAPRSQQHDRRSRSSTLVSRSYNRGTNMVPSLAGKAIMSQLGITWYLGSLAILGNYRLLLRI